jgi:CheY-like chemotaxis protein
MKARDSQSSEQLLAELKAGYVGRRTSLRDLIVGDIVIVDYLMPEMNGHEVAIEMRRVRPQTPIISYRERWMFLSKP